MKHILESVILVVLLLVWALFFVLWLLPSTLYRAVVNKHRAWRVLVGLDVAANMVFNDDEIQTISKRAALARNTGKKWGCILCKLLDTADKDHCNKSI